MGKKSSGSENQDATECTLDTEEEVAAVVIAALQLHYPKFKITPKRKLDDFVGSPDARAGLLPAWMREATRDGGCETRLGGRNYRSLKTVQDISDAIWADLKDKCGL